jgi:hypothetical protein
MKTKMHRFRPALLLGVLATGFVSGPLWTQTSGATAQAAALRPTLVPLRAQRAPGAHIELRASEAVGLRAVVQWQSGDGAWHDVDGWRSALEDEPIEWWVAPEDFGKGPFRWVAYREGSGAPQLGSPPFRLPNNHQDRTIVTLEP